MTLTIPNLQRDLMDEILCRVPLSFSREVRLTCKNWNNLSKNRTFSKMHIDKLGEAAREGESQMVVMMHNSLWLMSVVVDGDESYTESKGKLTCLEEQVKISQVFRCEGLLLCILEDDCTRLVVWNPYCGQTKWIEPRFSYRPPRIFEGFSYALGYENKKSGRRHKLLRFIDDDQFSAYEIYDFDSDLWTSLVVHPHWFIRPCTLGVTLKGNTYWGAAKRSSFFRDIDHIICFDFTTERFGPLLPLPFGIKAGYVSCMTMSCVREEKLAALFCQSQPPEIEIWITTSKIEFGKDMLWSKLFSVAAGPQAKISVDLVGGSFFIDEVKKVVMVFCSRVVVMIGYSGSVRFVSLDKHAQTYTWPWPLVCPYVPSVVQIKQPKPLI